MIRQYVNSQAESLGNIKTINDFIRPDPHDNGVQSYDEFRGELTHDQRDKSDDLQLYGCIRYIGDGKFICLPLNMETETFFCGSWYPKKPFKTFYNTKTYLLVKDPLFNFRCNCQGFTTKEKAFKSGLSPNPPFCAHVHALLVSFRNHQFDGGEHG